MSMCVRTREIMASLLNKAHFFLYLALICLIILPIPTVASALPGCPDKCGNIDIPFPFGTSPRCCLNGFNITCNESTTPHTAFLSGSNIELIDINISSGEARTYKKIGYRCFNSSDSVYVDNNEAAINIRPLKPFLFSHRRNKFTAIGCKTLGYISTPKERSINRNQTYLSGCLSFCGSIYYTTGDGGICNGLGCCQTSIPEELAYYEIYWGFTNNSNWDINPCMYAVLVEEDWYKFQRQDLKGQNFLERTDKGRLPIVLDWAIRDNGTCLDTDMEKKSHSACRSENSRCSNTTNGVGYICNCTQGYEGNPYLINGCTDIDECEKHPCKDGSCINIEGNYRCDCPKYTKGDGKTDHCTQKFPYFARVATSCILGIALLLGVCLLLVWYRQHKGHMKEKKKYNSYYLMMDKHLRMFSKKQIENATDNYNDDLVLGTGGHGNVYQGILENNQVVAIKKAKEVEETQRAEFVNEIILLSQINHKNIVRLLGCCLEVKIPMLIYEYVPNGTLFYFLHGKSNRRSISLGTRLKIAVDSAVALDHLHSSISPSIIHSDVKSANILLDENYTAKVSDFGVSSAVHVNEIVELVHFSHGYLDPECLYTQIITKKSDVYSFGVVMLELLTRKEAIYIDEKGENQPLATTFFSKARKNEHREMVDVEIVTNDENVMKVLEEICEISLQCVSPKGEERPTMEQVVKALDKLVTFHNSFHAPQIDQNEMESLLGEREFPTISDASGFHSTQYSDVFEIPR